MFQADPRGILAVIAVIMCWTLAVVLFRVGSSGSVARKLALLLVLEGLALGFSDALLFLHSSPEDFTLGFPVFYHAMGIIHLIGDGGMLALYPVFLAAALQTRMTRPFAKKPVRIGLLVAATCIVLYVVLAWSVLSWTLLFVSLILVFLFAMMASVQAWQTATGAARERAFIFLIAFGFRDLCWGFFYGEGLWETWGGSVIYLPGDSYSFGYIFYILGTLVAVPLIAYGILRTQLFDIDLKIRWTIKQTTLAGIFVSLMFLLSEGASMLLEAELGNFAGLIAAAVVMFFLAPLQRFSERVASAAMPNTNNTPEYATFRKLQVYESALAEALQEGGISDKERSLLVRLRESLGVSEADADAIENELQNATAEVA